MKKYLILLAIVIVAVNICSASTTRLADETLHYVISYKWGMIHKDAGTASLSLHNRGDRMYTTLTGRTKPWADKIFKVRDTLHSVVERNGFRPISYEKIAHENGSFSYDHIAYSYNGDNVTGNIRKRRIKKGKSSCSSHTLGAKGLVYDMLSIFYYLRTIDYEDFRKDRIFKATVFSGSKSETITIRPQGIENVRMRDKSVRRAFKLKFNFTSKGGRKSSDDIECWISDDRYHIPLLLIGSLPVGQVKCYLTEYQVTS